MLSHYLPPHVGGIEMVADAQAVHLANGGHSVISLAYCPGASSTIAERTIRHVAAWNGLERFGVPFPLYSPALFWHTLRAVRGADVVHVHDCQYLTSLAGALAARRFKKPLLVTQHVGLVQHSSPIVMAVQRLMHGTGGRYVIHRAHKIFVLNGTVKQFLRGLGAAESRIQLLPNGVDTSLFKPAANRQEKLALRDRFGLPKDEVLVLFVGRQVTKKGFHLLLAAAQGMQYQLVCAGSKEPPKEGTKGAAVHHIGVLSKEKMADLYRACDVFALPSESEGFPLAAQEAMASGLPIVLGADNGYAAYGLDERMVSFVQRDSESVRLAITKLLQLPASEVQKINRYGRDFAVSHFSWPGHIAALTAAYEEAQQ